ncbi:MAG: enoyl-CoA hydratase [Pelagibacteraceae bacterium]|nr:enoyl-CoA hydratase [Pelagibacteraceae bacterium]|tara:strand:+ start:8777 stop:9568 length:792 start_codon:yes stop_codon:yes gene_type:complete
MKNILIKSDLKNKILHLTLNNPENQNTLSEEMMIALEDKLKKASKNPLIKVIIISSSGKVFSAGHNLKDLNAKRSESDKGKSYYKKIFNSCSSLMINIVKNSKPIIAAVDGIATAAGCQLIASCDLAYASQESKFATPGVNIGLFCSTPMVALSRTVNKKSAMEMLLTGELIDAKKAYQIGLINNYYKSNQLLKEVFNVAEKISSKSMETVKIGKKAFYNQREMSLEDAYKYTSSVMVENILKEDSKEGINAFLEKRKPNWEC